MKKCYIWFVALFLAKGVMAQTANISSQITPGSLCANLTMRDMNGNIHSLYDYLDQGKAVILNVFEASSGQCWEYRQSGALQTFYAAHGPQGDNTAMLFALAYGNWTLLYNNDFDEIGNWIEGTEFPTIDPEAVEFDSHSALGDINDTGDPGYNSHNRNYCVCPDRRIYRLGPVSADSLYLATQQCELATLPNDAKIIWSEMDTTSGCAEYGRPLKAFLSNYGTSPLTQVEVVVKADNVITQTYQWTGNLPTYGLDTLLLNDFVSDGSLTRLDIFTHNPNGVADVYTNDDTMTYVVYPAMFWDSDSIFVEIQADGYGHQIYWDIIDANGDTIGKGGNDLVAWLNGNGGPPNGSYDYDDFQKDTVALSLAGYNTSCVTIRALSGMGYGTCCNWGSGYIRFKKGDEVMFNFTDFGRRVYRKITSTVVPTDKITPPIKNLVVFPNPADSHMVLSFGLQSSVEASISVFDIVGQRMMTLPSRLYSAGAHEIKLDLSHLPDGVYFATLDTAHSSQSAKFVVLR